MSNLLLLIPGKRVLYSDITKKKLIEIQKALNYGAMVQLQTCKIGNWYILLKVKSDTYIDTC